MKRDQSPENGWGLATQTRRRFAVLFFLAGMILAGILNSAGTVSWAQGEPSPAPTDAPVIANAPGTRTAEEIVAVVGDSPILRSEVLEQAGVVAEQLQVSPADTAAYNQVHREVLGRLIDDQILLKEAESQNLKVSPEEIDARVEEVIQSNMRQLGGPEAFQAQLKKEGITEQELRNRYREEARRQLLATHLVQKDVRPKVSLPADAARKFFEDNRSQLPKKPRALRIQDCFFRTDPDSVLLNRARERALEVRQQIAGGMPFTEAARKFSDDPRGSEGGVLGRFERGDLDPDLEKEAFALQAGEVSQPVLTRFGYHLITLTGKDPQGAWVEASHILFGVTPTRTDEEKARQQAQRVYEQVTAGQLDFSDAIRTHSDDPESKAKDGELGWIPINSFYGDMKAVADTLRVGRISPPVAGDGGYHVFKVLGEQAESNYSYEEVEDEMKNYAAQQAMEKELRVYLDELRKKYFVEIRTASW